MQKSTWGSSFFRKIDAEIQKFMFIFFCLNNSKIKIAKEDFHHLTQCCDNGLFMKKIKRKYSK